MIKEKYFRIFKVNVVYIIRCLYIILTLFFVDLKNLVNMDFTIETRIEFHFVITINWLQKIDRLKKLSQEV